MYALDRTHLASRDLDWLPAHLSAMRVAATGAAFAGTTLAAALVAVASGGALAHLAVLGAAGGFYAGHRGARSLVEQRIRRLARGLDLASIAEREDGELIHVRGRVRPQAHITGVLHGTPAVFRRLTFRLGRRLVHEAAVDFDLVDDQGQSVWIEAAGARLLAPPVELLDYPAARLLTQDLPRSLAAVVSARGDSLRRGKPVPAGEFLLRAGDEVEILGWKSRTVDARVPRLDRETPMRAALRSARALPLLVTPLGRELPSEI